MSTRTLDPDPAHRRPPSDRPPQPEQRRHARHELAVRCWITDSRHTMYLRIHDLSLGGLSVRAKVPFAPHNVVEVGLELPGGRRVRARGEVVWVKPQASAESGPRMGARFLDFFEGEEDLYTLLGNA